VYNICVNNIKIRREAALYVNLGKGIYRSVGK